MAAVALAGGEHLGEDLLGDAGADCAALDECDQFEDALGLELQGGERQR